MVRSGKLLPFLEEVCDPPFKVITHPRNFEAGSPIAGAIKEAMISSNAVIILMSQNYVTSEWCRYEFQQSLFEKNGDPAFRIIVIMLESVGNLREIPPEMDRLFKTHTYLNDKIDDPEQLAKIENILRCIKDGPKNGGTSGGHKAGAPTPQVFSPEAEG